MCNSKTGQNIFLHVPNTMEGTDSFKIIFIKLVFGVKLHDCIQVRHPPLGKKKFQIKASYKNELFPSL